jgi:glutamine synthetase
VLTPLELESRFEVYAEQYILAVEVEARLVLRMARTQIYPAVSDALEQLARSLRQQEELGLPTDRSIASRVATLNQEMLAGCAALEQSLHQGPEGVNDHLRHCAGPLLSQIQTIRAAADGLELLIDDARWPLPTYQEMLFMR